MKTKFQNLEKLKSFQALLRLSLCIITIVFIGVTNAFSQNDLVTITSRLKNDDLVSTPYYYGNGSTTGTVADSKADVAKILTSVIGFNSTTALGYYFSDVNYNIEYSQRTSTSAGEHLERLLALAVLYNKDKGALNPFYHDPATKDTIERLIRFYIARNPASSNWFNNYIYQPKRFGAILLQMKDPVWGLSDAALASYANAPFYYKASTKTTFSNVALSTYANAQSRLPKSGIDEGANSTEILTVSIYKACITNDNTLLGTNYPQLYNYALPQPMGADGFQSDYVYYQHGANIYTFVYGTALLSGITRTLSYTKNTSLAPSSQQISALVDGTLEGMQWQSFKNVCDFNTLGRGISYNTPGLDVGSSLKTILTDLVQFNYPYRINEIQNYYNYVNATVNPVFQSPGVKHFWNGDLMVNQNNGFYLSAKVASNRTIGTEILGNDNRKGKWLPWGSTNIMVDGKEYGDDVIGVWDWSKIPGVTSKIENVPEIGGIDITYISTSTFAGGVATGAYGLAAYDYQTTVSGITAKKSYFFTPNGMYCMGAGVTGNETSSVITTINQCTSTSAITINDGSVNTFSTATQSFTGLNWVHHGNVGYLFPNGGTINLSNKTQTGSWYNDISYIVSNPKATVSAKIFSAWFDHGKTPTNDTYEYLVIPNKNVTQFTTFVGNNTLQKLINTTIIQGFVETVAGVYALSFYNKGSINLPKASLSVAGASLTLAVSQPALVLLQKQTTVLGYSISVADPSQTLTSLTITLSGLWAGTNSTIVGSNTLMKFNLPTGDYAGKTLTQSYVTTTTGILTSNLIENEFGIEKLQLYPNPNQGGIFKIKSNSSKVLAFYCQIGNKVLEFQLKEGENTIYTNLPAGLYIVKSDTQFAKVIVY